MNYEGERVNSGFKIQEGAKVNGSLVQFLKCKRRMEGAWLMADFILEHMFVIVNR